MCLIQLHLLISPRVAVETLIISWITFFDVFRQLKECSRSFKHIVHLSKQNLTFN